MMLTIKNDLFFVLLFAAHFFTSNCATPAAKTVNDEIVFVDAETMHFTVRGTSPESASVRKDFIQKSLARDNAKQSAESQFYEICLSGKIATCGSGLPVSEKAYFHEVFRTKKPLAEKCEPENSGKSVTCYIRFEVRGKGLKERCLGGSGLSSGIPAACAE